MASRVVFVGNIPYDATEQQLILHFSSVGPVVTFRLLHDRDTGKPKGYGFAEYSDPETAQSAIRNLHQAEFHGRALRVDLAEDDNKAAGGVAAMNLDGMPNGPSEGGPNAPAPMASAAAIAAHQAQLARAQVDALTALAEKKAGSSAATAGAAAAAGSYPPSAAMDTGSSLDAPLKEIDPTKRKAGRRVPSIIGSNVVQNKQITHSVDIISKLVQGLSRPQQIEILTEMKKFISATPDAARQLLTDNPPIAQTVLQILVLYGLVRPEDIQALHINKAAEEGAASAANGGSSAMSLVGPAGAGVGGGDAKSAAMSMANPAAAEAARQAAMLQQQNEAMRMAVLAQQQALSQAQLVQQQYLLQQQALSQASHAQQQLLQQHQAQQVAAQQAQMPSLLQPSNAASTAGAPAAQPQAAAVAAVASQLPPAQQQILREVLKLSPDQIKQLPPQVQQQVYQLQQQLAMRR